jgi:hypothetical protein
MPSPSCLARCKETQHSQVLPVPVVTPSSRVASRVRQLPKTVLLIEITQASAREGFRFPRRRIRIPGALNSFLRPLGAESPTDWWSLPDSLVALSQTHWWTIEDRLVDPIPDDLVGLTRRLTCPSPTDWWSFGIAINKAGSKLTKR